VPKFVITSDTHLATYPGASTRDDGANQRLLDVVASLDWVLKVAIDNGAKAIIHGGDFFHDRKAVKPEVLHRAGEWIDRVREADIALHMLVGNHDLSIGGVRASSVRALGGYARIHDTLEVTRICGVAFGWLPYDEDPEVIEAGTKKLKKLGAEAVIAHLGIGDPRFSDCVPVDYEVPGRIGLSHLRLEAFHQMFIGHYHRAQELANNCRYIGSPLQLSLREAGTTKRCLVWDAGKDEVTSVVNRISPQFRLVTSPEEISHYPESDFIVVKAETREDAEAASEIAKERGNVRVDRIPPPAVKARIDTTLPDRDLVAAYVATHEVSPDDRDPIINLGAEILAHASERR